MKTKIVGSIFFALCVSAFFAKTQSEPVPVRFESPYDTLLLSSGIDFTPASGNSLGWSISLQHAPIVLFREFGDFFNFSYKIGFGQRSSPTTDFLFGIKAQLPMRLNAATIMPYAQAGAGFLHSPDYGKRGFLLEFEPGATFFFPMGKTSFALSTGYRFRVTDRAASPAQKAHKLFVSAGIAF